MDLTRFCDSETQWLSKPFNHDGYTFASNGHMLIRVPLRDDVVDTVPSQITMSKLPFDCEVYPTKFPEYKPQAMKKCPACDGRKSVSTCPECDGKGEVILDSGFNGYECDCKTCNGDGYVPGDERKCEGCDGTGITYVDNYPFVDIGDVRLNIKLLDKIKDLPGIILGPVDGGYRRMVHFRFDGGDGILMVMNKW